MKNLHKQIRGSDKGRKETPPIPPNPNLERCIF
jgi:hypothetical protein